MTKIQILNIILTFLILLICSIIIYLYKQPIINQLNNWKLLPQPERFTELYFENHLKLPSTTKINTPQKFSFTIHNLEYKTMTYPYEVYIASPSSKRIIQLNTVTLKHNEYKTINETFTISDPVDRAEIIVKLTNLNQQIDFWIQTQK